MIDRVKLVLNSSNFKNLLLAIFLICAVFPDVIFNGASLRVTDLLQGAFNNISLRGFYPVPSHSQWWGWANDNGGAIYQSEPIIEFMHNSIKHLQSPFWNPYQAVGVLGPEVLVSEQFSVRTILNALCGGGSFAYNIIQLLLLTTAVFFLIKIACEQLKLSRFAGIAMGVFYLLNGYLVSNMGSNVTQNYLYIPICLYTSFQLINKITTARVVFAILSFAMLLSCTFIPTTVISFITIFMLCLGFYLFKYTNNEITRHQIYRLATVYFVIPVCALILLSILYLPVLENVFDSKLMDRYSVRIFSPTNLVHIYSLFSSSLFYESFNAKMLEKADDLLRWPNQMFYIGVSATILCGFAIKRKVGKTNLLVWLCLIFIGLIFLRILDIKVIHQTIKYIPVISGIGYQYWWTGIVIPILILIGFGIDNLEKKVESICLSLLFITFGIFGCILSVAHLGLMEPNLNFKIIVIVALASLVTALLILSIFNRFSSNK